MVKPASVTKKAPFALKCFKPPNTLPVPNLAFTESAKLLVPLDLSETALAASESTIWVIATKSSLAINLPSPVTSRLASVLKLNSPLV